MNYEGVLSKLRNDHAMKLRHPLYARDELLRRDIDSAVSWRCSPAPSTVDAMNSLHCPNGCGPLTVFLSRRSRKPRPYTGCISCFWTDFVGANLISDAWCGALANDPSPVSVMLTLNGPKPSTAKILGVDTTGVLIWDLEEPIDSVVGLDPYRDLK